MAPLHIGQMKSPARYGFILLDDLNNYRLIVHTLKEEAIEYNSVEDIERDGWLID